MRRYFDERLTQEMLVRVIVQETDVERVVTTVYITSKIGKYMGGANR
jgi:nitrogen regulatory protein PII